MTNMTSYTISRHALQRAVEMNLEPEFIRRLLQFPAQRYWVENGAYDPHWMHTLDDVAAPCIPQPDGRCIVATFLPATVERWERESHPGRQFDIARWGSSPRLGSRG